MCCHSHCCCHSCRCWWCRRNWWDRYQPPIIVQPQPPVVVPAPIVVQPHQPTITSMAKARAVVSGAGA